MKRIMSAMAVAFFMVMPAFAQSFKCTILNAKGKPVKGMKVWRKNTTESAKTGDEGFVMFERLLPADTLVIAVSKKEEAVIPVERMGVATIVLNKKNFLIQEGESSITRDYSKVFRQSIASNVLTREQIAQISANSLYDILRSSIPGVTVTEGENGSMITIRGGNSFESDIEPLFVIDGAQYESSYEADSRVTVNDIERIEVLKDGAQYGVKGANGVIIISTINK